MRYISFAFRSRLFDQFNPCKRFVSYKTRINLALILSNMSYSEASGAMSVKSAAQKNTNCSYFAVNVLANGAAYSNSVWVQTESTSYIFNCGEGVQRLAAEHGQKVAKAKTVFVTYHSWNSIGGIMGLCLTLQAQGVKELIIYGPSSIKDMISGLQMFVYLNRISLIFITEEPRLKYDDSIFKVQFVPIYPLKEVDKSASDADIKLSPKIGEESESDSEPPSPKRRCHSESRPETKRSHLYSLCYICETPEFDMHLNVKKCHELGVPYGPLWGVLKSKNDVRLPNGNVVHWEEVYIKSGFSETFIVVDCPTAEYLESFVNEPEFERFMNSPKKCASLIIHFTEPEIMNSAKYREWMSRFPPTTKHMKVNTSNRVIDHVAAYRLQEKLHCLDPMTFPKLNEDNLPEVNDEYTGKCEPNVRLSARIDDTEPKKLPLMDKNIINSQLFLKPGFSEYENINGINVISAFSTFRWLIYPKMDIKFSHSLYLDRQACINEVLDNDSIRELMKEIKELRASWEASEEFKALPDYPKILFLGTGCSVPFALRNTSAILLELENKQLVLLDCGEGTYGQMLRFFGKEKIKDILKRLRLVYVSHQHADHHLGLINLLDARYKLLSQCKREEYIPESDTEDVHHLVMLLPPSVRDWVHVSNKFKTLLYEARILVTSCATKPHNALKRSTNNLGITDFKTVLVPHSHESYGVSFVLSKGYRITYSGDTMPSDNLVELGKDSDLLIHEATFEDGMEGVAKSKKHSTIGQALDIRKRMGAKFVMLTHFSQRYSHLPQLNSDLPENAGIAFDNMLITPKTMPFQAKLVKLYKTIFADKLLDLKSRTIKRMLKEEYQKSKQSALMKF